jgi:hypothetical protein
MILDDRTALPPSGDVTPLALQVAVPTSRAAVCPLLPPLVLLPLLLPRPGSSTCRQRWSRWCSAAWRRCRSGGGGAVAQQGPLTSRDQQAWRALSPQPPLWPSLFSAHLLAPSLPLSSRSGQAVRPLPRRPSCGEGGPRNDSSGPRNNSSKTLKAHALALPRCRRHVYGGVRMRALLFA